MAGTDPSLDPGSASYTAKFYGVRSGRVPGVYTDWASAEAQIRGVPKPKVKWFPTRAAAEAFVNDGPEVQPPPPPPPEPEPEYSDEDEDGASPQAFPDPPAKRRRADDAPAVLMQLAAAGRAPSTGVLKIYTDGSALSNGKAGSKAGVGVWFGDQDARCAPPPSPPPPLPPPRTC